MNRSRRIRATAGMILFALGVATGMTAQRSLEPPQRLEQKRTDLSGAPDMEVIASTIELKPGEGSERHRHHGVEVFHVLQGAAIQVPGEAPSLLATGVTGLNLRDVNHAGFTVVGDTPLKLFTVHIVDKHKPLYDNPN